MKLLLNFSYNVSLERWDEAGYISREISLYKKLLTKDIDITFLTYGTEKEYDYSDLLGKIKIIPVKEKVSSKSPLLNFFKSLFLPLKLRKLFENVDIIKSVQVYGSWIPCIAKILFKKKVVIRSGFCWLNYHKLSYNKKGPKNYIKYLIKYIPIFFNELLAYKFADGIISTNDQDISFMVKCFRLKKKYKNRQIRHFYNFIDEELFKPLDIKKEDKSVLFIGRLSYDKNLHNLITAFKDLDGFTLNIIGAGPDENNLKKLAHDLKINVNFLGIIPNTKISEYINQNQMFILPSHSEGNPTALLEAMSCGAACIGSDVKGINNLLKHKESGFLCKKTSESISEAIKSLHNDMELREKMGRNARKFILDNCTLDSITQKEYKFYKEILQN